MSWDGLLLCDKQDPMIGGELGYVTDACRNLTFQFINTYGVKEFMERCTELAEKYGDRFTPPSILVEKANSQQKLF
jgi:3-hydroxyacyl-CoA dehydrogenase/enoyl-CoA hydratase/3-hydroxybutyryl-CoA epimerase